MAQVLFANSSVGFPRIIYTPSSVARFALIHLQETGTLQATYPHKSERIGLSSFLFFMVVDGEGRLTYDGEVYELRKGDCVFIDCKKSYSHETGRFLAGFDADDQTEPLWSLQWCHFYGLNMNAIYHKYQERGGRPVFRTGNLSAYRKILDELSNLFYINKYYLLTLFKERYGVTINVYLNQVRVTYVKQRDV